jgi:NADPH:quinone reductase-like Zn-dependent oxidoreductase
METQYVHAFDEVETSPGLRPWDGSALPGVERSARRGLRTVSAVATRRHPEPAFAGLRERAGRVNLPAEALVPRPADTDAVTGAAVRTSYLTAYGALVEVGRLNLGDAVVIDAASSSVGLAAMQIANHLGAVPIAVTRSAVESAQLVQAGAAHVPAGDGDGTFGLADVVEAHRYLESNRQIGKIVVTVAH